MSLSLRRFPAAALATAMLSAAGAAFAEEGTIVADDLAGHWRKETTAPCAARYPAELLLRPGGLYEAPGAPEAGALWHGGEWRLEGDAALVIQMADDEMRRYRLAAALGDELALVDADGCRIVYRRASE